MNFDEKEQTLHKKHQPGFTSVTSNSEITVLATKLPCFVYISENEWWFEFTYKDEV